MKHNNLDLYSQGIVAPFSHISSPRAATENRTKATVGYEQDFRRCLGAGRPPCGRGGQRPHR
jgi:hypothetical protein